MERAEAARIRTWARRRHSRRRGPSGPRLTTPGGSKQTSPEVSTLAARYARISPAGFQEAYAADPSGVLSDLRAVAASALAQDETRGQ